MDSWQIYCLYWSPIQCVQLTWGSQHIDVNCTDFWKISQLTVPWFWTTSVCHSVTHLYWFLWGVVLIPFCWTAIVFLQETLCYIFFGIWWFVCTHQKDIQVLNRAGMHNLGQGHGLLLNFFFRGVMYILFIKKLLNHREKYLGWF